MRSLKLTLLIFAALGPWHPPQALARGGAQQPAAEPAAVARWARYTYPGEEFSVELPAPPAVSHTTRLIPNTRYEVGEGRVFGLYFGGVVFTITSYDDPRDSETLDHFDRNVWGGRSLTADGDTTLGGFAGRTYRQRSYLKGAARSFRTKKHAYLLEVLSDEEGHEQTFGRFLDSLALTRKPSGELIVDLTSTKPDAPLPASATPPPGAVGPGRGGGAGGAAGEAPLRHGEVTRKALIVFKPEPGFTEKARRNNTTGVVRLRCVLSSSGKVTNVSVVKGLPDGLTEKAVAAARHILFFPAVKDGHRVSQYVILEYNFNIY